MMQILQRLIQAFGKAAHAILSLPLFKPLKPWLSSSAMQQGLLYCGLFLLSLNIMAGLTYLYVEYQLNLLQVPEEPGINSKGDDVINQDDILDALSTGFTIVGFLVLSVTALLVFLLSRRNQKQMQRIEQVLSQAAQGDLSARIQTEHENDDLGRIATAIDDMLQRLQSSVASMQDISANIAHELKTPISRLRLWLTESCEKLEANHAGHTALSHALNESERISETFNALLRISQIESGTRRSRFSLLNVHELLKTVYEIYEDVAQDADMVLHYQRLETPEQAIQANNVLGDRELLIQLLANLIENAIRYCPAGTQITLSAQTRHQDKQAMLVLGVDDNGPGIPEAERERVFERLYRLDKSRSESGLGLGLSLVKAIVQLHRGRIKLLDNQPGLGVQVSLPLQLPYNPLSDNAVSVRKKPNFTKM